MAHADFDGSEEEHVRTEMQTSDSASLMRLLVASFASAAAVDMPPHNGMKVSVSGMLTMAARALREMAAPPDGAGEVVLEEHEGRLQESQPVFHAFMLDEFAKHLDVLRAAINGGDHVAIRKFFDTYVLD